ncbi:MAG: helix-turn-helix domain-containing protein [Candidatus Zixiibacteriota bacterium]
MTADTKIAQNRLTLLQLAEQIKNISEACRRRGVSRSQFYEYKRAFQEHGFEGLKDLPPIPKSCPHETLPEVKEKILSLSIAHPDRWPSPSGFLDRRVGSRFLNKIKQCLLEIIQAYSLWTTKKRRGWDSPRAISANF